MGCCIGFQPVADTLCVTRTYVYLFRSLHVLVKLIVILYVVIRIVKNKIYFHKLGIFMILSYAMVVCISIDLA